MANGHGGRRPGAGRKPVVVEEYRAKMQRLLMEAVTDDDARGIARTAIQAAKQGDADARKWLGPYVFGAPPKEVTVHGGEALRVEVAFVDETPRREA